MYNIDTSLQVNQKMITKTNQEIILDYHINVTKWYLPYKTASSKLIYKTIDVL